MATEERVIKKGKKSKTSKVTRRKSNDLSEASLTNLSANQLLKALRSFDQGDFSIADTVNARSSRYILK